jgi:hypothetical protein
MSARSDFRNSESRWVATMLVDPHPRRIPIKRMQAKRFKGVHFGFAVVVCMVLGFVSRSIGCGY